MSEYKTAEYWRQRLIKLRQEIESLDHTARASRAAVTLDQQKVGRLSRMDALQGQAMNQAIQARRRANIKRIDAALGRLDNDDYGYCLQCGDEISTARLEHDPTVPFCQDCVG